MGQINVQQGEAGKNVLRCKVKWFNLQRGYGFLEPEGGGVDIFMHFSVLEEAGYFHVCQGDEITCETGNGKNGVQVTKIHQVFSENGKPQEVSLSLEEKTGVVKWFNILRGYGFIQPDDNGRDIFVHTAPLKRLGIDRLPRGQRVRVKVLSTEHGSEAREVILEPPYLHENGEAAES